MATGDEDDLWWFLLAVTYVATSGLLLMGDRYVELLAAATAYAAGGAIARHATVPTRGEQAR